MGTDKIKKSITAASLMFIAPLAMAQGLPPSAYFYEPPNFCNWGLVEEGNVGVNVSYNTDDSPGEWDHDIDKDYDFLLTRSEKHIAIGRDIRIKGDGAFILSYDDTVYFYDSLTGYNGFDKANLEGNAYLTYTVQENSRTGHQIGWVWTMKKLNGTPPWCSKRQVYFQYPPTVGTTMQSSVQDGRIDGVIYFSGTQDPYYSKHAVDLLPIHYEVQRKLVSKWTGSRCDVVEESEPWVVARYAGPSTTYSFSNLDCEILYRTRSFDGVYYSDWSYDMARNLREGSGSGGGGSGGGGSGGGGGSCVGPACSIED